MLSSLVLKNLNSSDEQFPKAVDVFFVILILLNVFAIILDAIYLLPVKEHDWILLLNNLSVLIFTAEYIYRTWSVANRPDKDGKRMHPVWGRLRYMITSLALIDLVVILPFYLELASLIEPEHVQVLKLLWFFKLTRYNPKIPDIFLIALIYLNILATVLESVNWLRMLYGECFELFENGCVVVFTAEYFLRLTLCVKRHNDRFKHPFYGRIRYLFSPLAIVDLLAVLPFYVGLFFGLDLPLAQVLRLFRTAKLARYSSAMKMLLTVLWQEMRTFGAALVILMVAAVFSAGIIYLAEKDLQPEVFGSIPDALYWSIITLTTIGYGDVTPITALGKFFSVCTGIIGIGMVALPAGILASAISDYIRRSREEYESKVEKVLRDGRLSNDAIDELETTRANLGLKQDDAGRILDGAVHTGRAMQSCPHCGKPLTANKRKPRRAGGTSNARNR